MAAVYWSVGHKTGIVDTDMPKVSAMFGYALLAVITMTYLVVIYVVREQLSTSERVLLFALGAVVLVLLAKASKERSCAVLIGIRNKVWTLWQKLRKN